MDELELKPRPTLADFQEYVERMTKARGFTNTNAEVFMLFLEEVGELAKAARKREKAMRTDAQSAVFDIELEAADVFLFLLDICNRYGVDLEKALRKKEEINKTRSWAANSEQGVS